VAWSCWCIERLGHTSAPRDRRRCSPSARVAANRSPLGASANNFLPESTTELGPAAGGLASEDTAPDGPGLGGHEHAGHRGPVLPLLQRFGFLRRQVGLLNSSGRRAWGDVSPGRIADDTIYHAPGVVAIAAMRPNHIYIATRATTVSWAFAIPPAPCRADLRQPMLSAGRRMATAIWDSTARHRVESVPHRLSDGRPRRRAVDANELRREAAGQSHVPDFYNNRVLMFSARRSARTSPAPRRHRR